MTTTIAPAFGWIPSGDVEIFYRRFGSPGGLPLLILHGANYYDSRDWVDVAAGLAADREVVTYDARGFGLSGWSPSQDYSLDAQMADLGELLDHLQWERAIFVGHSRGGSFALRFSHEQPQRVAGLILVDFSPGHTPGRSSRTPARTGRFGPVFDSLAEAHAASSRNDRELDTDAGRMRAEAIFAPRDGGWVNIRRDPAYGNGRPIDRPEWTSALAPLDLWDAFGELVARGVPTQVIRGTRSRAYDEAALQRMAAEFPQAPVVEVESGHDIPGTAPADLVRAIIPFLR